MHAHFNKSRTHAWVMFPLLTCLLSVMTIIISARKQYQNSTIYLHRFKEYVMNNALCVNDVLCSMSTKQNINVQCLKCAIPKFLHQMKVDIDLPINIHWWVTSADAVATNTREHSFIDTIDAWRSLSSFSQNCTAITHEAIVKIT